MRKLCLLVVLTLLMFGCQSKEEKELYKEIVLIHQEQKFNEVVIKTKEFKEKFPNSKVLNQIEEKEKEATETLKKQEEKRKEEERKKLEAEKIKVEKIKNLLSNFNKKYDEFKDVTFYNTKQYTDDYGNIHIYIGQSGKEYNIESNSIWFRVKFTYQGNDWVFFDNIKIKTDNNLYDVILTSEEYRNKYTDTIWGGGVIESTDLLFVKNDISMLRDIVNSKEVKIRYEGDKRSRDKKLSDKDKNNLAKVLEIIEIYYGE